MSKTPRLEDKIRPEIQQWFDTRGDVFILSVKEFCQGNRASLAQVMAMVEELSARVFKREGKVVNIELLEDLEYGIFDLIGKFTSTPGGDELLKAIQENIVEHLTELFAKTKKQWNLNHYKITTSFDELDPCHSLIPDSRTINNDKYDSVPIKAAKSTQHQAKDILDELVSFAKDSFRGEKKRNIAVNWLENPEKIRDFCWLSSLVGTSTGSTKVILTRIKHSFTKVYDLKTICNKIVLVRSEELNL